MGQRLTRTWKACEYLDSRENGASVSESVRQQVSELAGESVSQSAN